MSRAFALAALLLLAAAARAEEYKYFFQPFGTTLNVAQDSRRGAVVILPFASVEVKALWQRTGIPVCWENPEEAPEDKLLFVRKAVKDSWEKVSLVTFDEKWDRCPPTVTQGIRIRIVEAGPFVQVLGRYLAGMPSGMVLNLSFAFGSPDCLANRDLCIWATAVHEFGHALGFAHEQNRLDSECRGEEQGTRGDWNLGEYDPESVMNYCSPGGITNGTLSDRDIRAVQEIYGKRS